MKKLLIGFVIVGFVGVLGTACSMEKKQEAEGGSAVQKQPAAAAPQQAQPQAVEVEEVEAEEVAQ